MKVKIKLEKFRGRGHMYFVYKKSWLLGGWERVGASNAIECAYEIAALACGVIIEDEAN